MKNLKIEKKTPRVETLKKYKKLNCGIKHFYINKI